MFGGPLPLRLRCWDGSIAGPATGPTLVVHSRRALAYIAREPNDLGLGRAYVAGDIDVDGDLFEALRLFAATAVSAGAPPSRLLAWPLGVAKSVWKGPTPPLEEARLHGAKHTKARDAAAIKHHYDVGNEFYRHLLGESMVYSCAYWREGWDDVPTSYTLTDAQRDKCELIVRKLDLQPGQRMLDVGCGWGTLAMHAAASRGATVVGVTLSAEQAKLARQRVAEAGLASSVEIRVQDYRDIADGPFDAITSVGMAEHVGQEQFSVYAQQLFRLLRPGGRLLNHQITRPPTPVGRSRPTFISSYVFPDGELLPLGTVVDLLEGAGFEARDVESLREHYARTLRCWVENMQGAWDECVRLTSLGRARVWLLYMAGCAVSFETGGISINQVLLVRPDAGRSHMPPTRAGLLAGV